MSLIKYFHTNSDSQQLLKIFLKSLLLMDLQLTLKLSMINLGISILLLIPLSVLLMRNVAKLFFSNLKIATVEPDVAVQLD